MSDVKRLEFGETSIGMQFVVDLMENHQMVWEAEKTADFARVFFATVADVLKANQNTSMKRIGFNFKDDKGEFKFGAILTFRKPDDSAEEDSGNWYLEMTFNSEDMKDLDLELDNHSDIFIINAAHELQNICYGRFRSTETMHIMFNCLLNTITKFLDVNASETEEVEVVLQGVFTASVAVEDGKKLMFIEPGEYIKQLIKSDAAL